ncbi:MAG: DUF262 domain-containing protein [Bacteroidales bacterium]|nr:DUF262 domain-containing protein [Bacteroidales bacterium]
MKTGKYTLREFFSDRDLNTIIIPEIQRDYVWGKEQINKFLESIVDDFNKYKNPDKLKKIQCDPGDEDVKNEFEKYYKRNYLSSNIGFIYAYSDSDYPGSYFLIDGQQRFTTIFLTLLVLAANGDDDVMSKFKRTYLNEGNPKLDYRVREASHVFLYKMVQVIEEARNELSSSWIKQQSWYLQDYDNDATITSIIANIDVIKCFLKKEGCIDKEGNVNKMFWEYVEDYLEFWYFDTNISEQGEELYIYMNARGESMQENENLKADLIGGLTTPVAKKEYGKKWENWQDLFWKEKGKNANADNGFNEFLCCIAGLENYLKPRKSFVKDGEIIPYDNKKELLPMKLIEHYWNGFNRLFLGSNMKKFSEDYFYSDWLGKAKESIWDIFNNKKTNWFADFKDDNRATERNRMVYVWSMLYYMKSLDGKEEPLENIYRTLRLFYVRYNNYDRAVEKLKGNVDKILDKVQGPWDTDVLNEEEQKKYGFLKGKDKEFEAWIWKIEDHPLNLNGRDVRNINCSHIIDFEKNPSVADLENIYNRFCSIFSIKGDGYEIKQPGQLLNSLLYTSIFDCGQKPFWDKHDTGYYERLFFDRERRYIRGLSTYGNNNVFKTFFDQFVVDGNYVNKTKAEIEAKMHDKGVVKEGVDSTKIIWALVWYAATKGTSIWNIGKCFIYNYEYEGTGNKDLLDADKTFQAIHNLVNCAGNVRNYQPLSGLIDL